MNKRLLSVCFAALLLLALLPGAASADSEVTLDLGRVRAGDYMSIALASVGNGSGYASLDSGAPPAGCSISADSSGDGQTYYLRGTPMTAGVFSFTVKITEEIQNPAAGNAALSNEGETEPPYDGDETEPPYDGDETEPPEEPGPGEDEPLPPAEPITIISVTTVHATLTVLPAVPTVEVRDAECFVGETVRLTADAQTRDYGSLRYQWYFNPVRENHDGQPLLNQTSRDIYLDAEFVGDSYYYCVVTNENNGYSETVASPVVTLRVKEPVITRVSLATWPTKLDYTEGEKLDTSGLTLLIEYSNGGVLTVDSGFTAGPSELNNVGQQIVSIRYQDYTVNYTVNVKEEAEVPKALYVAKMPSKFSYKVGDTLDTSGLELEIVTNKGNKTTYTYGFVCSPTVLNTPGTQTITVSCEGLTTQFNVIVSNSSAPSVQRIRVQNEPVKTSYQVGDYFDPSGLMLCVTIDNKDSYVSDGYTYTPTQFTSAGTQTVTVSYLGQNCTLTVTVSEKPADSSQSDSDSGHVSRDDYDDDVEPYGTKKDSGSNLVAVIMIAAVLALTTLCILLYVSRRDKARAARARASRRRRYEYEDDDNDFR